MSQTHRVKLWSIESTMPLKHAGLTSKYQVNDEANKSVNGSSSQAYHRISRMCCLSSMQAYSEYVAEYQVNDKAYK
jgi:hypothetical protein